MRPTLKAAALLLLLAAGFYWKLTFTKEYLWMDDPDISNQVIPWWNYEARELHAGRFPLWEPHQWAGQPLIGQMQPGAAYPLNWPLFLTPLRDGKLRKGFLDLNYVFERYLAALNCFLLCWYLRRGWWSSIVAACVFGFGGYIGTTIWPQMVNGALWLPLILLFTLRAVRERTAWPAALSGFFLGIAWLSGHHQGPTFMTYTVAGVWVAAFIRDQAHRWALLKPAAVMGAFVAMTAALQLLPAYEYGRLAVRWVGAANPVGWLDRVPYQLHTGFSLKPDGVLGLFLPPMAGGYSGFIGSAALLLGIAGIVLAWRHPMVRFFAALSGIGVVIALGAITPLHGLAFAWLPMMEKARTPAAAILVFNAAFAVLIAFGLDALPRGYRKLAVLRQVAYAAGAVIIVLFLSLGSLKDVPARWSDQRTLLVGFCLLIGGALLAGAGRLRGRQLPLAFLAVILVENTQTTTRGFTNIPFPRADSSWFKTQEHYDIAAYLKAQPGAVRVAVDERVVPYNFGDFHGIDAWTGYLASVTANTQETAVYHPKFQQALGITHGISDKPTQEGEIEVFRGQSGVRVYYRPNAFPRAWSVHSLRTVQSVAAANVFLASPEADLRQVGLVVGGRTPTVEDACGIDHVKLLRDVGGEVEVSAEMACAGVVVLGDVYFPGWRATVDGRDAEVFAIDGALRGVAVPKGRHQIGMHYRPWTVKAGAVLLLMSVAGLAVLGFAQRRRSQAAAA